jgi:glutamine amidotransferase
VRGEPDAVAEFFAGEPPEHFQARSRRHTAGWGIAWYVRGHPRVEKHPVWVREDTTFLPYLRKLRSPTVVAHVRRATRGVISKENTHPFVHRQWSFAHNGTIVNRVTRMAREWLQPPTEGTTDSEVFFHLILHFITAEGDVVAGTRAAIRWIDGISTSARLNFVLSDGERIYAYRRGHTLYHFAQEFPSGIVEGVSSDNLGPGWRTIGRDWMITLDGSPSHDRVDRVKLTGDLDSRL